ncbi:MAG: toast rack family protein [Chloroflexota bacterium]
MKRKSVSIRLASAALVLWFGLIACGLLNTTRVNEVKSENQSIDLDFASMVRIQIEFPAGELNVKGGTSNLMEASFRYNVSDWQPQVKYSENGTQGDLLVSKPGAAQLPVGGEMINEWEIQLNENIPMDLIIRTGAGNSQLDLGRLDMTSLKVETGAGTTTVNLDGNWQHDVNVSITGGIGELTVNLPAEMGVRVEMDTALVTVTANGLINDENGFVNQAFGTAPYTLTLNLQAGVGSVTLIAP